MSIILRCGFKPVNLAIFRQKSLSKGKKLVESHHVSDVHEIKVDSFSKIQGTVLRETPGAVSTRTKTNLYKPTIEVDLDRNIVDTDCTCKGGKGYCKHAAAICIFVNEENIVSKTDVPQTWNRPPTVQLKLYHTGLEVENIWKSAKANRDNATTSRNTTTLSRESLFGRDTHFTTFLMKISAILYKLPCTAEQCVSDVMLTLAARCRANRCRAGVLRQ